VTGLFFLLLAPVPGRLLLLAVAVVPAVPGREDDIAAAVFGRPILNPGDSKPDLDDGRSPDASFRIERLLAAIKFFCFLCPRLDNSACLSMDGSSNLFTLLYEL